jgi:hypothetical protein
MGDGTRVAGAAKFLLECARSAYRVVRVAVLTLIGARLLKRLSAWRETAKGRYGGVCLQNELGEFGSLREMPIRFWQSMPTKTGGMASSCCVVASNGVFLTQRG